jgi:antitoxin (DNA-binding transcriptional repressor) of toxin-antitoxin stability system
MKRVTASEARRNWFQLLDEVLAGEIIKIERNNGVVVLKRETRSGAKEPVADYTELIRAKDADHADRWGWDWNADGITSVDLDESDS